MDVQLGQAWVPLLLAVAAVAVLALEAFLPPGRGPVVLWVAVGALAVAFAGTVPALASGARAFCRTGRAAACAYELAPYGAVLHLVLIGGGAVVLLLSARAVAEERIPVGEYAFLLLCSVTGALVLTAAGDLATLVVGLETVTLPVFGLVALRRHDPRGGEAAVKLFLVSIASTAVLLFGISWIYAVRGSLWFADLDSGRVPGSLRPVLVAGVVLAVVGFGFKVAAVPFHAWVPDTYVGAPLPVAAYLAVVSKVAGFAGLVALLGRGLVADPGAWAPPLAVIAALTMTVGNVVALRQRHAVRLLAWSSIAQAGYALAPFAAGASGRAGVDAVAAPVSYLVAYAAMTMLAFAVVVAVARDHPGDVLGDYRGLLWRRPAAGAALAFALVALAGLPPGLVGLFAKIAVFRAVVEGGVGWLAVVMAVNTVVALYYYLSWALLVVARPAPVAAWEPVPAGGGVRPVPVPVNAAIAVSAVAAVAMSVAPQLVFAARTLFP